MYRWTFSKNHCKNYFKTNRDVD